jgi:hypothetical protein
LPASSAGAPQVTGVGVGLGAGVGVGEGDGEGDGLAAGEGLGEGEGVGEGDGEGDAPVAGATRTCTLAVACDDPERATRLKLVVHSGRTWRVPDAVTTPMPLSISTVSAPSTSQVSVVAAPVVMSPGAATNFWIDKELGWVNSLTIPQLSAETASPAARSEPQNGLAVSDMRALAKRTLSK